MQGSHTDFDDFSADESFHHLRNPDVGVRSVTQPVELALSPRVHRAFSTQGYWELGSTVDLNSDMLITFLGGSGWFYKFCSERFLANGNPLKWVELETEKYHRESYKSMKIWNV